MLPRMLSSSTIGTFRGQNRNSSRAIQLNPNSVCARGLYGLPDGHGPREEAISKKRETRRSILCRLGAVGGLAATLYWARHYDEAIELVHKVLAISPNRLRPPMAGAVLEQKREFPAAIAELQKSVDLWNDRIWIGFVAHARAVSGDKPARVNSGGAGAGVKGTYISPWWLAIIYPDLGDKDKAFFWLEKAYRGREHDLVFSKVWPMFDSLRSDPRYQDLMRRVGLPE